MSFPHFTVVLDLLDLSAFFSPTHDPPEYDNKIWFDRKISQKIRVFRQKDHGFDYFINSYKNCKDFQ